MTIYHERLPFPNGAQFALYDGGNLVGKRKVRQQCGWTAGREIDWHTPISTTILLARPRKYDSRWVVMLYGKLVIETPHTDMDAALMYALLQE